MVLEPPTVELEHTVLRERGCLYVCMYRVVRLELQAGRVLTSLLAVFLSAAELNNTQVIAHNHSPSLPELSTKASN